MKKEQLSNETGLEQSPMVRETMNLTAEFVGLYYEYK